VKEQPLREGTLLREGVILGEGAKLGERITTWRRNNTQSRSDNLRIILIILYLSIGPSMIFYI
jgi:hypothetical protein